MKKLSLFLYCWKHSVVSNHGNSCRSSSSLCKDDDDDDDETILECNRRKWDDDCDHVVVYSQSVFGVSADSMQCSFDSKGNSVPTILLLMQERLYSQGGLKVLFCILYFSFTIFFFLFWSNWRSFSSTDGCLVYHCLLESLSVHDVHMLLEFCKLLAVSWVSVIYS